MKKKSFVVFTLVLPLFFAACTKDRVKNPDTLNFPQTTIYSESFDDSVIMVPALPDGWSSTAMTGWVSDSSNFSIDYSDASGYRNLVISNDSVLSSYDTLFTGDISTARFQNITVTYGARRSTHFADNGSAITGFEYSIDEGNTWMKLSYVENPNDSHWYLINSSLRISLPADASNQSSIRFRWTAHLFPTSSGTYRIDDFRVLGTSL